MGEFDRVVGWSISTEIQDKWPKLATQLLKIAGEETDNDTITTMLSITPPNLTNSKITLIFNQTTHVKTYHIANK